MSLPLLHSHKNLIPNDEENHTLVDEADRQKALRLIDHYGKSLECIVRKDNMTEQGRMAKAYLAEADE